MAKLHFYYGTMGAGKSTSLLLMNYNYRKAGFNPLIIKPMLDTRDGQFDNGTIAACWKNSTNGTYVNSTEVGQIGTIIKPGDIISVGDTKFRVEAY